jgi:acetyl esterase/lipase
MLNLSRFSARMVTRVTIAATAGLLSACSAVTFGIANAPASFGPYERRLDISYGTDKRQRLDVYLPKAEVPIPAMTAAGLASSLTATSDTGAGAGADTDVGAETEASSRAASSPSSRARPVVIFWYGGSWQSGNKSDYRFVGAALAERGFITVLPDYRLYPEVKFPAFLDDAALAVAWIQKHAHEFGGDPQRIVLMGHSAGAHTAAFIALNRTFLQKRGGNPEWIAGLVGLSGPYALAPNTRALNRIFAAPWGESDWQPVRFATSQAPPTFLAHGLSDGLVSVRQTMQLRDVLSAKGVRVETELYPDTGHAATVAAFSKPARGSAPTLDQAVAFLNTLAPTSISTAQTGP